MTRRAILQIGTEKTGTTTLQHFLAANRATLAARGFLYPRFCGALNHTGLAALALDPARMDPIRHPFGVASAEDVPALRDRLRAAAASELAGASTVVFCNEHCHSRLTSEAEVATLRDFLAEFFDEILVAVYLRRQDQVALSRYSTFLKSGGTDTEILPDTDADDLYFNYDRSLGLWESAFGVASMRVRLFDRRQLVGASVVSDFAAVWGIGDLRSLDHVPDQNVSIETRAQEFLRRINPRLERLGPLPLEEVRGPLTALLAQHFPGHGARPSRAAAEAFFAQYQDSNEAVRQRYFPDQEQLFDADFSSYPETADDRDFGADDLAEIAARVHMASNAEVRRLQAEISIRDAKLHWARNEPDAAERAMDRALAWKPGHAEAYRTLAEQMFRRGRLIEAAAAARQATECRPDSPEYWHFFGTLLDRTGDLEGAAQAQRRALELNPGHAASRKELDRVLARLGSDARELTASRQPGTVTDAPDAMAPIAFSLSHAHLEAMARHGLQLGGLLQTNRLAAASRIEAPTALFARTQPGAFLDIGAFCNLSGGGAINNVRMGRYCSVAGSVKIGSHEHPTDWLTTSRVTYEPHVNGWDAVMAGPNAPSVNARKGRFPNSCPITTLGPDVWIGHGAFIKAGVTIGAGAIVGAHATVVRDVPPYAIVAGTPAKALRLRFSESIVERLLALQWWRYSVFDLFDAPFHRIEEALDAIESLIASGAILPFTGREVRPADLADPMALAASLATPPLAQAS